MERITDMDKFRDQFMRRFDSHVVTNEEMLATIQDRILAVPDLTVEYQLSRASVPCVVPMVEADYVVVPLLP